MNIQYTYIIYKTHFIYIMCICKLYNLFHLLKKDIKPHETNHQQGSIRKKPPDSHLILEIKWVV